MTLRPADTLYTVRHFLFSKTNREFLIFLLFLAVSGIFWLMMTLNETYEQDVKFTVRYVNVPQYAVLTSSQTDTVRASISDKGFSLLAFVYSKTPHAIDVDFMKYDNGNGKGVVSEADLQHLVEQVLPASAKVTDIKTDKLEFYYNNGEKKKVPVRWRGQLTPDPRYFISKTVVQPDSVVVYASREKLDSIHCIYTNELKHSDIHDTLVVKSSLQHLKGVKTIPEHVTVNIYADVLTEETIDSIPIIGVNMPAGKVLRTFPPRVSVKIVTGMKNYKVITPSDILVVADYEQFKDNGSDKCPIVIKKLPEGITRATLAMHQVDYLIENVTP